MNASRLTTPRGWEGGGTPKILEADGSPRKKGARAVAVGRCEVGPHDHSSGLAQLRHCNQKIYPERAASSLTVSRGVDDFGHTATSRDTVNLGDERSSRGRVGHPGMYGRWPVSTVWHGMTKKEDKKDVWALGNLERTAERKTNSGTTQQPLLLTLLPPPHSLTKNTRKIATKKPHFEFGFAAREVPGDARRCHSVFCFLFYPFFFLSSVEHDTRTSHHTQHPWRRRKGENPPKSYYYTTAFTPPWSCDRRLTCRPEQQLTSGDTHYQLSPNHFTSTDFRFQHQPRGYGHSKGRGWIASCPQGVGVFAV